MSFDCFSYSLTSKWFDKLVIDYINQIPDISHLFNYPPDKKGFQKIISDIQSYFYDRNTLSNILLEQAKTVSNTSKTSFENIELLKQNKSFTITTGHQLCLFTGPVYFIYKIAAVIQLSHQLKQLFPEYNFIPVFWMATEDHDAEEINHFYFNDKKMVWNISTDGTPVGNIKTNGLIHLFNEMQESNLFSEEVLNLFHSAYISHSNIADATWYIVNYLFGEHGIVIIDASHKDLKKIFSENFFNDIFENSLFYQSQKTIQFLKEQHYNIQAYPLLINTFFIHQNKRYLIQKENELFKLKATNHVFSNEELKNQLNEYPEKFSPNVLLRPVYQQKILPNITYIGGSSEIAYWLTLKEFFNSQKILYPILIQRPSLFLIPEYIHKKINKLNIKPENILNHDIHQTTYQVLKTLQLSIHLDKQKNDLKKIYEEVLLQTQNIDKPLIPFVNAELTKSLKSIETIEQKLNRSIKQKNEIINQQLNDIYNTLFLQNTMQDRIWNITYAAKIMGNNSLKNFTEEISKFCSFEFENYQPLKLIFKK